jgi:hypothetical protein
MGARKPMAGHGSISDAVRAYAAAHPKARQHEIAAALGCLRSHVQNALAVSAGHKIDDVTLAKRAGCIGAEAAARIEHRSTEPPRMREMRVMLAEGDFAGLVECARSAGRTPADMARALMLAGMGKDGMGKDGDGA